MSVPTKCSSEEKLKVVQDYLLNKRSSYKIAKDLNVISGTVSQWLDLYEMFGEDRLTTPSKRENYPTNIKVFALND